MSLPDSVKIVEVGPRDGLQNEPGRIPAEVKVRLIEALGEAGLSCIEPTSFVSPEWVPQLADAETVMTSLRRRQGVAYPALVPNRAGLKRALACGATEIAVFTAASDAFNQRNINCDIAGSLDRLAPVVDQARSEGLWVRGYVSCVLGCPYAGEIQPTAVARVASALHEMGCHEISLGDTIGIGTPLAAADMVRVVAENVPVERLAVHFHDTRGQALANILSCLEAGVTIVDASVAGLGGCPYARGATGNVATEDLLYMLQGMGIETGVDIDAVVAAGLDVSDALSRPPGSRLGRIAYARREAEAAQASG